MCKVIIKEPKKNKTFILYNHLYSRENSKFTETEIKDELLQKYHLNMTIAEIKHELIEMIRNGLIIRNVNGYSRAAMV